jgi:hypothetical protein
MFEGVGIVIWVAAAMLAAIYFAPLSFINFFDVEMYFPHHEVDDYKPTDEELAEMQPEVTQPQVVIQNAWSNLNAEQTANLSKVGITEELFNNSSIEEQQKAIKCHG